MKDYFKKFIKPILTLSFLLCILGCIGVSAESPEIYTDSNDMISLTAYQSGESSISYHVEATDKYSDIIHDSAYDYSGILYVALCDSNDILIDLKSYNDNDAFENVSPDVLYTVKAFVFDEYTQQPICNSARVELRLNADFSEDSIYTFNYGIITGSAYQFNDFNQENFQSMIFSANNDAELYTYATTVEINNPPAAFCDAFEIQPTDNKITITIDDLDPSTLFKAFESLEGYLLRFGSVGSYIHSISCAADDSDFSFLGAGDDSSYDVSSGILRLGGDNPTDINVSDTDIIFNLGGGDDKFAHGDSLYYDERTENCWIGTKAEMIDFSGSAAAYSFSANGVDQNIILIYNSDNPNKPEVQYDVTTGRADAVEIATSAWGEPLPFIRLENGDTYEIAETLTIINPTDIMCETAGVTGTEITINISDLNQDPLSTIMDEFVGKELTLESIGHYTERITIN